MMNPRSRLWASILLSAIATPVVVAGFYQVFGASSAELVSLSVIFYAFCMGTVFLLLTLHDLIHSAPSPFKGLFILSATTFFLSIVAALESLQKTPALYLFLAMAVLFFLTTMKSRSLWLKYPTGFGRKTLWHELSRIENAWVVLYVCAFFLFIFLAGHYLGWIPA